MDAKSFENIKSKLLDTAPLKDIAKAYDNLKKIEFNVDGRYHRVMVSVEFDEKAEVSLCVQFCHKTIAELDRLTEEYVKAKETDENATFISVSRILNNVSWEDMVAGVNVSGSAEWRKRNRTLPCKSALAISALKGELGSLITLINGVIKAREERTFSVVGSLVAGGFSIDDFSGYSLSTGKIHFDNSLGQLNVIRTADGDVLIDLHLNQITPSELAQLAPILKQISDRQDREYEEEMKIKEELKAG